jgi:hypothetical protein
MEQLWTIEVTNNALKLPKKAAASGMQQNFPQCHEYACIAEKLMSVMQRSREKAKQHSSPDEQNDLASM